MARRAQKTKTTLVNGGTTPVIYTDDGRVLAAGHRITLESSEVDDTARALVERGHLLIETDDSAAEADTSDKGDGDRDAKGTPGASDQETAS